MAGLPWAAGLRAGLTACWLAFCAWRAGAQTQCAQARDKRKTGGGAVRGSRSVPFESDYLAIAGLFLAVHILGIQRMQSDGQHLADHCGSSKCPTHSVQRLGSIDIFKNFFRQPRFAVLGTSARDVSSV